MTTALNLDSIATAQNELDLLKIKTHLACDTMDAEFASKYGPFRDCTSNQAIALAELSKPKYEKFLQECLLSANASLPKFLGISVYQLAVEIAMVKLQVGMSSVIDGRVHIQTNPFYSYSTELMVASGFRIAQLCHILNPNWSVDKLCIKIPSTWEGMMACRILENAGIRTLATTVFTFEQGALAAEVGCTYIAPYVNELKVHFQPGFVDQSKLIELCYQIQDYYRSVNAKTEVMAASLTSTDEIRELSSLDRITIPPGLAEQFSEPFKSGEAFPQSIFAYRKATLAIPSEKPAYLNNESEYRLAFTRNLAGASERKLSEAINIFCEQQDGLENLMKIIERVSV